MGVQEYLSKGVIIQATTRSSRKCELMKLSVPFVSSMYANAAFTVAAPKYWNSLPNDLRTISSLLLLNIDYIHIYFNYNIFFLNLLLFVYFFIYLLYYFKLTHINVYRFH